jgi:hypothetical protein
MGWRLPSFVRMDFYVQIKRYAGAPDMALFRGKRFLGLIKETRSATALEFAMIGLAFFTLIFGIFVVSLDQFLQMTLDDSVRNATRKVQIGANAVATAQVITAAQFKAFVCGEFGIAAPNCSATLQFDVQQGPYFGGITPATISSSGNLSTQAGFPSPLNQSGATSAAPIFLLVQVVYPLPFKIMLLASGTATQNGTPSLVSTVATAMTP